MYKILIYIITSFLEFFFARKFLLSFNTALLKLIIRFLGYNNHKNFYSSGEIYFLRKVCKEKPKICLDIGANVGKYSSYLLENSSAKIIAFEPIPKTFNELIKIKKNYSNRFFIYNIGLGEKKTKKNIYYDKDNLQWANFNPEVNKIDYLKNNKKKIKCSLDTLDNFTKKNKKIINSKIDLLKIDTEGFELEVLLSLSFNEKIDYIVYEDEFPFSQKSKKIKKILTMHNYVLIGRLTWLDQIYKKNK